MVAKSKLQTFIDAHPYADLLITTVDSWGGMSHAAFHYGLTAIRYRITNVEIARYSRRRDAVRALKKAGLTQEGCYWRSEKARQRESA